VLRLESGGVRAAAALAALGSLVYVLIKIFLVNLTQPGAVVGGCAR
jgi:hypothetical protein